VIRLPKILLTSRALLGLLMLWFGTHHLAPGFEQHVFQIGLHSHSAQPETLQWSKGHPHLSHCDFCNAFGFLGVTLENTLPRTTQLENLNSRRESEFVPDIPLTRLARAPPARQRVSANSPSGAVL
jgi:hypothetical protein